MQAIPHGPWSIDAVTVEGVTGRTSKRFGGLGLKQLRHVCVARGGSLHVTTATVDPHFDAGHDRVSFVERLDGTVVEIDFRPGPERGARADANMPDEFF